MIFVSTGGNRKTTAAQAAMNFFENGINGVELSGGAFSLEYKKELLSLPKTISLRVHNYFPPPQIPFVLNLASIDPEVSKKSISHVREAMKLAVLLGRPIYSFHAGFRINPQVSELGNRLSRYSLVERDLALELFGERVIMLAEEARKEGVTLLIENNVLNRLNLLNYGEDPLLLTEPNEIDEFMSRMPSNVGLLLDVAHLKVSAHSLNFNLIEAHSTLRRWIRGYHLSDNDGSVDSNEVVHDASWFWEVLIPNLDYYSLEIYKAPVEKLVKQFNYVKAKISEISINCKSRGS